MPPTVSNGMTMKRIHREIVDLQKEDMGGMSLEHNETNLFLWTATIPGPEGSPYDGGLFKLAIELGADYPFSAPKVTFLTRIYHMNISDRGGVCIDVLKQNWSPALSLYKVLLSLSSLLTDPNPKDPLVPSIATEYVRNRQKHDNTARQWTQLYAVPKPVETAVKSPVKNKGKAKAAATTEVVSNGGSNRSIQSRRSTRTQLPNIIGEVIDLSDSDHGARSSRAIEGSNTRSRAGAKRKRGTLDASAVEPANGVRRRRTNDEGVLSNGEVIVIED